jgi:hypothetical protein
MRRRLAASLLAATVLVLLAASSAQAAPGSLRILVVGNEIESSDALRPAVAAKPGVSAVDVFDSQDGTPDPALLSSYDMVVGTGDSFYDDPVLWGDRLADYLDAEGALVQFAYDNWEQSGAHPEGRFESGGYAPFIPGPNDNDLVTLGTRVVPDSPFLVGVGDFTSIDNTTVALAPGATLLAKWSDDRNAIALKGRVLSASTSPEDVSSVDPLAQLVVNAGNAFNTGKRAAALKKCKKLKKKKPKGKTKKQRRKSAKKLKKGFKRCKKKARQKPK